MYTAQYIKRSIVLKLHGEGWKQEKCQKKGTARGHNGKKG
jgi:hypothetical protein